MSEPRMVKYWVRKGTILTQKETASTTAEAVYLAAYVDAFLRQREEELAKAYQRANIAEANQRQLAGTVKEVHTLRAQLAAMTAELEEYRYMAERAGATKAVSQLADCQQQLAAAQARCVELEDDLARCRDINTPTERPTT